MKEQTDLEAVKALAHAMLELDIEQTKLSPLVVKHPFTDNGFSGIRKPDGSIAIADLLNKPDELDLWRKQVGSVIDEADSAFQIYMMVTKSYALGFLKFARNSLSEKDFADILADAWMRTEAPNNDPNLSKRDLLSLFQATDPALLMSEEDYQQFKDLDDVVTVYRGVTSMNAKNVKALSWTLDQDTAEWFAHRFGESGTVYEAQIRKEHIYAYFSGRNESEVIVDPKHLMELTQVQAMEQQVMGGLSSKMNMVANPDIHQNIRDWYTAAFPTDELGAKIKGVTFSDLAESMNRGEDIYETLGVDDSILRERVFDRIATILEVDYDAIYYKWLDGDKAPDIVLPEHLSQQSMTMGGM